MLTSCEAHDGEMVALFSDQAVGGAAPADQRPGLSAALAGVKQHGTGALLVATRDRLARDTLIAALVEQRAQELGAAIRAVDGSGNTDTPEGVLVRRIIDAFAEYERLTIKARTKAALAVKRLRRERISREPPYGWRLICLYGMEHPVERGDGWPGGGTPPGEDDRRTRKPARNGDLANPSHRTTT